MNTTEHLGFFFFRFMSKPVMQNPLLVNKCYVIYTKMYIFLEFLLATRDKFNERKKTRSGRFARQRFDTDK